VRFTWADTLRPAYVPTVIRANLVAMNPAGADAGGLRLPPHPMIKRMPSRHAGASRRKAS
jgi:hypothetical protein